MLNFAHYGEERDLNATPEELKICELIAEMLPSQEGTRVVRKSDDYITLMFGEWDLARVKYTPRAKWVNLSVVDKGNFKRRIADVSQVEEFREDVIRSYEHILKYS